jgi:hypothetical protein
MSFRLCACASATIDYYRRWAFPLAILVLLPLTLGRSMRLWHRLAPASKEPGERVAANAHFLIFLGAAKVALPAPFRPVAVIVVLLLPVVAVAVSLRMTRRHGARVRAAAGIEVSTQRFEQFETYMRNPALLYISGKVDWYYRKHLYLPALRSKRGRSLPNIGVLIGVSNAVWRKKRGRRALGPAEIDDKDMQRRKLRAASVPTLPLIGRFGAGKAEFEEEFAADKLPETGLFAKPRHGLRGRGATAWRCVGPNRWVKEGDVSEEPQSGSQIVEHLRNEKEGYLLQPRLTNQADLVDLTGDTLCSLRVLTYTDPSTGAARVFPWAFMKISRPGAIIDNMVKYGSGDPAMGVAVDIETGTLGPAFGPDFSWQTHHPDRGAAIMGRSLDWKSILAVAEASHRAFMSEGVAYGWDIAPTDAGPMVIEGNAMPGFGEAVFEGRVFGDDPESVQRLVDVCLMAEAEPDSA